MFNIRSHTSKAAVVAVIFVLMITFYGFLKPPEGYLPWHQQIIVAVLTPFQKSVHYIGRNISSLWHGYFDLVGVRAENARLKKKMAEMQLLLGALASLEAENKRLSSLMEFRERHSFLAVGAHVLGNDPRSDFRVVTIDRGSADGVAPNKIVAAAEGLVGRVVEVASRTSKVLLITDPNNAVDVVTERSRMRALLVGTPADPTLTRHFYVSRLEYLERRSDIVEGDVVVTSGWDGLYPSGIPVGTVQSLKNDSFGLFKETEIVPFVDFGRLSEVIVILQ